MVIHNTSASVSNESRVSNSILKVDVRRKSRQQIGNVGEGGDVHPANTRIVVVIRSKSIRSGWQKRTRFGGIQVGCHSYIRVWLLGT